MTNNNRHMWLDKTADFILRPLKSTSWALSRVGAVFLALLMFLTAADVFLRYLFNRPIVWAIEITELMMIFLVFCWVAYTMILKGHITIELVVSRLPPRARAIIDSITSFFSLGVFSIVVWQSVVMAQRHWLSGLETAILRIPIYPFLLVVALGCALLALVILTGILKSVAMVIRK